MKSFKGAFAFTVAFAVLAVAPGAAGARLAPLTSVSASIDNDHDRVAEVNIRPVKGAASDDESPDVGSAEYNPADTADGSLDAEVRQDARRRNPLSASESSPA